ncbi:FliM/FliN family flagellar motor switch protein [Citrobacter sp. JGM124]|uniref:FliM/FliN family flagellar motor switch protein n=1 Tax=Citrobacter sp. JGM124 TaxID=2799789 RepID=UPI001BA5A3CC|nr:FliM/FliN family flagellar motor switch protein [Citrobacter sp. JGM124]MBS0846924.1 FliM/FliN family flagellar motor switch protein [Citrobacter sp. JGM124]
MNLRQYLRVSNLKHSRFKHVLHCNPGRVIIETQTDIRYLQLKMIDEYNRQVTAFFDIDSWLHSMDSHLPGIPWQQVPLGYLASWLNTLQLSFLVEGILWTVEHVSMLQQPIPSTLVSLIADPCTILCADWPGESNDSYGNRIPLFWLPLTLNYVLGTSKIPLSVLTKLISGDLLLIKKQQCSLDIGGKKLFTFNYQGNEGIIVTQSNIVNVQPSRGEEEHLLDWTNLPVDLEFVLDSHVITLGDLNNITAGSMLPVSTDAEQKIKIYLNRKFFATGELVALESGGLAVEINQINMSPENKTSHPDVK